MNDELINAVYANDINKVRELVAAGADIDKEDEDGDTALDIAVFSGKIDMVRFLVKELGADINKKLLQFSIEINDIFMVRLLVELGANIADINKENKYGQIPLKFAIKNNNPDMVRLLIELGADINKENKQGITPLEYAIMLDKLDMVKLFVKLGVDINKENKDGETPLLIAIYSNNLDMVKLFVNLGANISDINKEYKMGKTPLQYAIKNNNQYMIDFLVKELGADINNKDSAGDTPLFTAVFSGNIVMVRFLVKELGANVNLKNKYGKTAYSYARCYPKILEILKEAGATIEEFKNQLLYLTHVTTSNNFSKMLESGKIYSNVDMWYISSASKGLSSGVWKPSSTTQYPGVYMTLINNELVGEQIRLLEEHRPICLVFCISLLNRQDFHYNNDDSNGYITSKYTSFNVSELEDAIEKKCITKRNEVIFHHSVSLKYLKEIWVGDEKTYNEVKDMLKKKSLVIPVEITNQYLNIPRTCDETIKKLPTNYCYYPSDFENRIELIKKIGEECGLTGIDNIDNPYEIMRLLDKRILPVRTTIEGVKEYLKSKGVSDDTIEHLSESQLKEVKDMNLIGLNFLKNYSRFDGGKGRKKKLIRKKSRSKRKKSGKKKSRSKRRKSPRK